MLLTPVFCLGHAGTGADTASLQLKGTGCKASDFAWTADSPSSFSAANAGQTLTGCGLLAAPPALPQPPAVQPPPAPQSPPANVCSTPTTPISAVQGSGAASPLVGQQVTGCGCPPNELPVACRACCWSSCNDRVSDAHQQQPTNSVSSSACFITQMQTRAPTADCHSAQVTVGGVVTGSFQGPSATGLSGYFIQTPGAGDGNPATSEGA